MGQIVNLQHKDGFTALQLVANLDPMKAVRVLVKLGADVDVKGTHGVTAFHRAASQGRTEAVKVLLELGADVNAREPNSGCTTSLHTAAQGGCEEAVKVLVELGADVLALNNVGRPPLKTASLQRHTHIVRYLSTCVAAFSSRSTLNTTDDS